MIYYRNDKGEFISKRQWFIENQRYEKGACVIPGFIWNEQRSKLIGMIVETCQFIERACSATKFYMDKSPDENTRFYIVNDEFHVEHSGYVGILYLNTKERRQEAFDLAWGIAKEAFAELKAKEEEWDKNYTEDIA